MCALVQSGFSLRIDMLSCSIWWNISDVQWIYIHNFHATSWNMGEAQYEDVLRVNILISEYNGWSTVSIWEDKKFNWVNQQFHVLVCRAHALGWLHTVQDVVMVEPLCQTGKFRSLIELLSRGPESSLCRKSELVQEGR